MAFEPTREQQFAIDEKGNVLVAAAAGSGKTAVLVERVIKMLTDEEKPVDANRLLIVTFTNAAAAEMRSRIEKRLNEECLKNPNSPRLLAQKLLIPSSKICTIDSFCIDLIRENFEKVGVSPDFKVGDEAQIAPLSAAVFAEMIDGLLTEKNPVFRDLLDVTNSEFDEQNFIDIATDLFKYSRQMPFPEVFLRGLTSVYNIPFGVGHPWFDYAMSLANETVSELQRSCAIALDLSDTAGYAKEYSAMLGDVADQLYKMKYAIDEADWDTVVQLVRLYHRGRAPSIKGSGEIPQLIAVKELYNDIDSGVAMLSKLFFTEVEFCNTQLLRLKPCVELLVDFVIEYAERLFELQCRENVFTFYNTEQLALSLLCEYRDGALHQREDVNELLSRFDEVLVDEYQDTNDLQNTLFKVLSNNEQHLFIVGDVKQSIYAFRGANPQNFLKKKNTAVMHDLADNSQAKKIILSKNFRSREGVCDYVNFFFRALMNENTGDIIYNSEEELVCGAAFPPTDEKCVDLLVIDNIKAVDEDEKRSLIFEARRVAQYIKAVMSGGECIREDKDTLRKARYGDFAILLRSTKNKSSVLAEELRKQGIPVNFAQEEYLENIEIQTFLSLLDIIDNPDNDISLLTVMLSPIFGFTAEELASIRAENKKGSLLSAVNSAANNGEIKVQNFLKRIDVFRRDAALNSLPRLISLLLSQTDYLNIVSAMTDGAAKRANLLKLTSYASKYAENFDGGLSGFLHYLRTMPEGGLSAAKQGAGSDFVRIMSMHASKGLQFPVCILCNVVNSMYNQGTRKGYLFSEEHGIGLQYFDEELKKKLDTVGYEVLSAAQKQQRLAEELRLLYVAMTRAEEKLVIVSSNTDLEKKLASLGAKLLTSNGEVTNRIFSSASSMNDWVLMTSLLHKDGKVLRDITKIPVGVPSDEGQINIDITEAALLTAAEDSVSQNSISEIDYTLLEAVKQNLEYKYSYLPLIDIEAKSTVSRLANQAESDRFAFTQKPTFMQKNGISAAGRGTATHKVMQYIKLETKPDIDLEIERLIEWQFISETEAMAVDRAALQHFFDSELYSRLLSADELKREMRFLTEIPAVQIEKNLPDELQNETVMVQGAVDLCAVEADGLVIVDFKTDRVNSPEELITAYSEQLNIYAMACAKIYEKPVKQRIIYSFCLGDAILLP